MIFTAGQVARYNTATKSLSRGVVAVAKIEDWKAGRFDFTDESLGDIAIELEHYYNVTIDFKYPGLRKYPVSASFAHQTPLLDILHTLCLLNQNHVTQTDAQHYVIH
jgi:ferric-dicitrate binding protein FerR (iron transport regulator)